MVSARQIMKGLKSSLRRRGMLLTASDYRSATLAAQAARDGFAGAREIVEGEPTLGELDSLARRYRVDRGY